MRFLSLALVILCAPLASAAQTVTYQLRGFTTATVLGDHGVLEMTRQCAVEFGEVGATRMCTSSEILNTATVPQGLVGDAWVRPAWQPSGNRSLDDSGRSDALNLTCSGFASANPQQQGLIVDGTGSFYQDWCNVARPIACCHPVVVPEPTAAVGLGAGAAALAALGAGRRGGGDLGPVSPTGRIGSFGTHAARLNLRSTKGLPGAFATTQDFII